MTRRAGGADPGVPGSGHCAPPPREDLGRRGASRAVPPRLTQAQTHLGSRAGSPRPLQRGSGCRGQRSPALIPVRSLGASPQPRRQPAACAARAAPPSRREPRARRRPARPPFPSPPGRPSPGRALAARLHPGPVRPAGQPFLARPAESRRWPHPPGRLPRHLPPCAPPQPTPLQWFHCTDDH